MGNQWRQGFKKLPIKTKLIIFMTILIVLTSLVNLYFYYEAYIAMDEFNEMLQEYSEVNVLSMRLLQAQDALGQYVSSFDRDKLKQFLDSNREMNRLVTQIAARSKTMDTYLWCRAVQSGLAAYNQQTDRLLAPAPGATAFSREFGRLKMISGYLESYIKQLLDIKLTEGEWYQQRLAKRVRTIRTINFASVIGIAVFSLFFVLFLSRSITEPLLKLTRFSVNIAQGNFKVGQLAMDSSEDINILAFAFNKMAQSIENMIQEITAKSDLERQLHEQEYQNLKISEQLNEAKLLALQSQINPHFLFNTLNAIMRLALFEKAVKTTGLIESLSRIFRYNLGSTQREVLLTEELAVIEEYLSIQQTRFGDRIQFSLISRADISRLVIPRFTIQPLVENAIVHGLEPKENGGAVRIKIYLRGRTAWVRVIDNGVGIANGQLARIRSGAENESRFKGQTTGIGLANVRERMVLYNEEEQAFRIWSKPALGTVVTLQLKLEDQ